MAVDPQYLTYLDHFGARATTVFDFVSRRDESDLIALRHDVDHCIDTALEAAHVEAKNDVRSSYYILHSAPYASDDRLVEKCLALQDLGHEVGLHVNLLAQWWSGEIDDIGGALERLLNRFRTGGVDIKGTSAHGDPLCYSAGFANYWLFSEVRPDNPVEMESGMTAEGEPALAGSSRRIDYNWPNDVIKRPDGKSFPLWSLKLSDFGLVYEASRILRDGYFSDSGGSWRHTADPIESNLQSGRHVVLMHPIHWRAPQRHTYILSTARSGSKWLANLLAKASTATARHEFMLNFEHDAADVEDGVKKTGVGFSALVADRNRVRGLIQSARDWSEGLTKDYVEANVYLPHVLDDLPHGADTNWVHLHRDPRAVVRSLLERRWYETPFDPAHPMIDVDGFASMTQFEQICWYVRDTNERLRALCDAHISFEKMVSDRLYLRDQMDKIDITLVDRFMDDIYADHVNATSNWSIPDYAQWSDEWKETYTDICGAIAADLGYPVDEKFAARAKKNKSSSLTRRASADQVPPTVETLADLSAPQPLGGAFTGRNTSIHAANGALMIRFYETVAGYALLGGGAWSPDKVLPLALFKAPEPALGAMIGGWARENLCVYTLNLIISDVTDRRPIRIFCLSYDDAGALIDQRVIGVLSHDQRDVAVHFQPVRRAARFNIALHRDVGATPCRVSIDKFLLVKHHENRALPITPAEALANARPQKAAKKVIDRMLMGPSDLSAMLPIGDSKKFSGWNVEAQRLGEIITLHPDDGERNAIFLFGGGSWRRADQSPENGGRTTDALIAGWATDPADEWRVNVEGGCLSGAVSAGVFLLYYDADHVLIERVSAGALSLTQSQVRRHFGVPPGARRVNLGVMLSAGTGPAMLSGIELARIRTT